MINWCGGRFGDTGVNFHIAVINHEGKTILIFDTKICPVKALLYKTKDGEQGRTKCSDLGNDQDHGCMCYDDG